MNGVGKTTFFDVFGFLHDALQTNTRAALAKHGGFSEVISRGQMGAPWKVLEFSFGEGVAADGDLNEYEDVRLADRSPQKLDSPDILS